MVRALFLSALLVFSTSLSAAEAEFQFDATGVSARVTPYATTYWMCAGLDWGAGLVIANDYAMISDSDGDGVVRWELAIRMPSVGLWTMVDSISGTITTRDQSGSLVSPSAFPPKAFLRDEVGSYSHYEVRRTDLPEKDGTYLFWVRPGVGAWAGVLMNDGGLDELFGVPELVRLANLRPAGGAPGTPAGLKRGDLFIIMGRHAEFWTGDIVDRHLHESEGPGVIQLVSSSGSEELGRMRLKLARLEGTSGPASVRIQTADLTALAGTHYRAVSDTVRFNPGQIIGSFDIPLIDDATVSDAWFQVRISDPTGASLGSPSTMRVDIPDNDRAPFVSIEQRTAPEGDGPQRYPVNVSLSHRAPRPVRLEWKATERFSSTIIDSGVVEFAAGEKEKPIEIRYVADDLWDLNMRMRISITNAVNAVPVGEGSLVLIEDDTAPVLMVDDLQVGEERGAARLTVRISAPTVHRLWSYHTEARSAKSPEDFAQSSGYAESAAGSLSTTIVVPIRDDDLAEGPESFDVVFPYEQARATVTIIDDETPRVTVEHVRAIEGDGGLRAVPVRVVLSRPALAPVRLRWKAHEDPDRTLETGALEFAAGEQEKTVDIHYVADDLYGGDRQIGIFVTSASNATESGQGKVSIVEDDPMPSITMAGAEVAEGAGEARLTVALSAPLSVPLRVAYQSEAQTAAAPDDFTLTAGVLEIPAGATSAMIVVPIRDDGVAEGPETFEVVLPPTRVSDTTLRAPVTIVDDDAPRRRGVRH